MSAEDIRKEILNVIGMNPKGHLNDDIRTKIGELLTKYVSLLSNVDDDDDDVILTIGKNVYGWKQEPQPKVDDEKEEEEEEEEEDPPEPIVDFDYMKSFMKDVFLSYGVPEDRAETCSEVLIESDKRGIDSHGLGRLKPIYCDRMDAGILFPSKPISIIKETRTSALIDGHLGLGLYIGPYCMNMAIQKAKEFGVGFVACQNSTHYGIAGYYATMASDVGCIGLTGTNARPSIAPTFGVEPMLGTNPLTFGIPTNDGFPFVIDCATSVNQRGKIERYAREGKSTPRGAVIDNDGIERTDTDGILRDMILGKCALTPLGGAGVEMGGYKGYGWATVIELLCTSLQSGPFGEEVCGIDRKTGEKKSMPLGHFFLAIDIEPLCNLNIFKDNSSKLLNALRQSRKSPLGPGRIWTAGEPEYDARMERMKQGGMKVSKALQTNMKILREEREGLKEKYPKFPFE